jgi:hypothetical protein
MLRSRFAVLGLVAALSAGALTPLSAEQDRRAVPRERQPPPGPPPAAEPQRSAPEQRRAVPRQAPPPRQEGPRREPPRRSEIPPGRVVAPRVYHFPPIDVRRGFYYHPYFGFYYGPYYGPFYPYSGPYVWPARYMSGAVRTRVQPRDTEVWVNGYYAGIADDFDGVFQRLYLPGGEYRIELRLAGYLPWGQHVLVRGGATLDIVHTMLRQPAGQPFPPAPAPLAVPEIEPEPQPGSTQPASPYGILALHVTPSDAQVTVDGEAWAAIAGLPEVVIHLPAGWHDLQVRKEGFQPFSTRVQLTEGQTTRLAVSLAR